MKKSSQTELIFDKSIDSGFQILNLECLKSLVKKALSFSIFLANTFLKLEIILFIGQSYNTQDFCVPEVATLPDKKVVEF